MDKILSITINVTNLKRAANWYLEHFSCKLISETEEVVILQFDNIQLQLTKLQDNPPHITVKGTEDKFDHDTFGNIIRYIK